MDGPATGVPGYISPSGELLNEKGSSSSSSSLSSPSSSAPPPPSSGASVGGHVANPMSAPAPGSMPVPPPAAPATVEEKEKMAAAGAPSPPTSFSAVQAAAPAPAAMPAPPPVAGTTVTTTSATVSTPSAPAVTNTSQVCPPVSLPLSTELSPLQPSSLLPLLIASCLGTLHGLGMVGKQQLPPGWSQHEDPKSGAFYYCNITTGETSWSRPTATAPSSPPPPQPVGVSAAGHPQATAASMADMFSHAGSIAAAAPPPSSTGQPRSWTLLNNNEVRFSDGSCVITKGRKLRVWGPGGVGKIKFKNFMYTAGMQAGASGSASSGPKATEFVRMEGYLTKLAHRKSLFNKEVWQKRFFVLEKDTLTYYKNDKVTAILFSLCTMLGLPINTSGFGASWWWCVCVCVCESVRVCIYLSIDLHICFCLFVRACVRACIYPSISFSMCVCMCFLACIYILVGDFFCEYSEREGSRNDSFGGRWLGGSCGRGPGP